MTKTLGMLWGSPAYMSDSMACVLLVHCVCGSWYLGYTMLKLGYWCMVILGLLH
jgi:hypothetical protein